MKQTCWLSHSKPGLEAKRGRKEALVPKCLWALGQRPACCDAVVQLTPVQHLTSFLWKYHGKENDGFDVATCLIVWVTYKQYLPLCCNFKGLPSIITFLEDR